MGIELVQMGGGVLISRYTKDFTINHTLGTTRVVVDKWQGSCLPKNYKF